MWSGNHKVDKGVHFFNGEAVTVTEACVIYGISEVTMRETSLKNHIPMTGLSFISEMSQLAHIRIDHD